MNLQVCCSNMASERKEVPACFAAGWRGPALIRWSQRIGQLKQGAPLEVISISDHSSARRPYHEKAKAKHYSFHNGKCDFYQPEDKHKTDLHLEAVFNALNHPHIHNPGAPRGDAVVSILYNNFRIWTKYLMLWNLIKYYFSKHRNIQKSNISIKCHTFTLLYAS